MICACADFRLETADFADRFREGGGGGEEEEMVVGVLRWGCGSTLKPPSRVANPSERKKCPKWIVYYLMASEKMGHFFRGLLLFFFDEQKCPMVEKMSFIFPEIGIRNARLATLPPTRNLPRVFLTLSSSPGATWTPSASPASGTDASGSSRRRRRRRGGRGRPLRKGRRKRRTERGEGAEGKRTGKKNIC